MAPCELCLSMSAFWPLWVAVAFAVTAAGAIAWIRHWRNRLTAPVRYDAHHRLTTDDGCACALDRLLPNADAPGAADLPPVLIVHGLAINQRNCDAFDDLSLARDLRAAGRDVWLLTLRSGLHDLTWRQRQKVCFAAMADQDVPLAVAEVRSRTGADRLDLIGFSMGGMLLYGSLGRSVDPAHVRRVVIYGSPGMVRIPIWPLSKLRLPVFFAWLAPRMPYRALGGLLAPFVDWYTTPLHRIPYNPDNVAKGRTASVLVDAIEDVPWALHRDFARWAITDGEIRVGNMRALDSLRGLTTPVRFFAGAVDGLAPPPSVALAFAAWGASVMAPGAVDKTLHVLGRATGCVHDYGHGDLMFGSRAGAEVFPPAIAFLQESDR